MKKWFVVFCFSIISVSAFAQLDPHHRFPKEVFEHRPQEQKIVVSAFGDPHVIDLNTLVERKVAQAQMQEQPSHPSWPNGDEYHDVKLVVSSQRPSYYAGESAYQTCSQVSACTQWAQEQAQKEVHFQVLSATLFTPTDPHGQRLEVTYVITADKQIKWFEKDFNGNWKASN